MFFFFFVKLFDLKFEFFTGGSSVSTRYVNGRKVTTKRTFAGGVETVKTYEDDALVSHTVNGQDQAGIVFF